MTTTPTVLTPEVLIIGGGPAGLTAAAALAPRVAGEVLVLDREEIAGGIPRHSDHIGYGMRDLRRVMTGPAYARHLVSRALTAGATLLTEATVTHWTGDHAVEFTSPRGRRRVEARAVVLATGARERPRAARRIPGDRPAGVYTTGQLQNEVHLHHRAVGRRAVVVGGELVSWSAVVTLREAGCETGLMVSRYPRTESYAAFNAAGRALLRVPVAHRGRVTRIQGRGRVEAVELEDLDTGARRTVECDTVVFTGDWIPDNELARAAGLDLDTGTLGPLVDTSLRTSRAGVFAVGNLLHPVDTADVAALDGAHVARQVESWLSGSPRPAPAHGVRLLAEAPLRWVSPGLLRPGDPAPPRGRLLLWTDRLVRVPRVAVVQDGRVVARRTLPWPAAPGRVFRVPWSVLKGLDPRGGPVTLTLR
ncbi:NAD(P)/FAD-dependent oxidoreductase [Streptomyces tsukubensis]|uniref:Pyridine nucleotide-disulfide oxidoreductase n=1 Tax=Streptomyces tsukubensis TaxID=83656 RepID=A0A1V4AH67_9ACTN|nr:FAD-dependent oxidoreductase [Streptomyces tsukubensis]OON83037.1 pyridine nucleotide-disulfide oxidoreductase [Streptomyces tsukubensis]QFR91962.1 NAD(P)-binding protein [Streptomyces tsukubensis]